MKRAYRVVWGAGLSLSLNLLALPAHAGSLFVGTGGSGGTSTADDGFNDLDGAAGGIAGGNGGKGYYTQGAGGGSSLVTGTVVDPGSAATSSGLGTTTYDYVVVGGGGGGGSGTTNGAAGDGTGGTGGQGALTVDGSGLTVNQTFYVGGFGGGAGGGEVFTRGGNGGTGGAGAATLTGGGTTTANGVVVGGLEGAGGASGAETGAVGAGGSGTLDLGGGSTLSVGAGGIVLNGNGTLNIGNGTANGASAGTLTSASGITDNGVIDFNQSDASYTFGTNISGGGKVVQNAAGTTVLSGVNGYTGGTTVNAGYLSFSASGNLGTGGITLNGGGLLWASGSTADISNQAITLGAGGGTFAVNGNAVTLASGSIHGAGSLTVDGAGTLTLSGANSYTGSTFLNAGSTLAIAGSGSIVASSGVVDNGTFDISGTTGGTSIKTLTGSGTATLGGKNLTVTNAGGTYSGTFTGSGKLIVQGSGLWVLDGVSSAFTGGAEVQGGTLEVGDIGTPGAVLGGNVQVDAAGTLRGHGTIQGDVANNGTVAPGGSIGTLTVTGNYTQASTAMLSMEVSPTQASQLKVTGTASLAGTLGLTFDPGTYASKQYTLVSAAGGRTGTFATVGATGASGLTYSLSYGANTVDLLLSGVVTPINTSIYSAVGTATLMGAQSANAALLDRADASGGVPLRRGSNVWAALTGSRTVVDADGSAPGFQNQRYGFLAGRDRGFDGYTAGVAFGYEHADIQEQRTGNTGKTDTLRAALYGNRALGPLHLSAVMGVGLDWLSQSRPFGAEGTAQGDHLGQEVTLGAQASLPLNLSSSTAITPRLGLRYAYFHGGSFGESGAGGQDLNVGSDNVQSLQPYAGLALDHVFGSEAHPARVQLRVGYAFEALDANRSLAVSAQDGTRFTTVGASLPRGYLTAGLGLTLHPMKNLDVSLDYDALFHTGRASAQQGSLRVAYRF